MTAPKGERAGFSGVSDSNSNGASGGITLVGAVFVVFLILKLAEVGVVATWSWWWVTSPLWLVPVLVIAIAVPFLALRFVFGGVSTYLRRRKRMAALMED